MKKFLLFVSTIAVMAFIGYYSYPTQTQAVQRTLQSAWHNAGTAVTLSVQALWKDGSNNTTATKVTQAKEVGVKRSAGAKNTSKPAQNVVVYQGGSAAVAPPNATCFINGTTGASKRVSSSEWNAFVKAHPNYSTAVTTQNGQRVYVAMAPNLDNQGTQAQQNNRYYVAETGSISGGTVTYGYFEAQVKAHANQGWKVFHHGNQYALVAPNEWFQFSDGTKVTN